MRENTTRPLVIDLLARKRRPMTAAMIREALGRNIDSMQLTLACMDGDLVSEDIGDVRWYARHGHFFRPYRLDYLASGNRPKWRAFRWTPTEMDARQEGAFFARHQGGEWRLVHNDEVIARWNVPEAEAWLEGKRTLSQVKKVLRDQSNSQIEVLQRALSLRR